MLRRGLSKRGNGFEHRQMHAACSKTCCNWSLAPMQPQGLTPSAPDTLGSPLHTLAVRS